jgi:hypothetical protein
LLGKKKHPNLLLGPEPRIFFYVRKKYFLFTKNIKNKYLGLKTTYE